MLCQFIPPSPVFCFHGKGAKNNLVTSSACWERSNSMLCGVLHESFLYILHSPKSCCPTETGLSLKCHFIFKKFILLKYRRRQWHPTPLLLPGKSHGWRSLVGCSLWGREESDTTERLLFHFSISCIGEGNGNPLHCSCLENPRAGGAWWAAVYGVSQSWT